MIIRSQNRKGIVNFNRIDTICTEIINPKKESETSIMYYCGNEETKGMLGTYSTEEKAIKVLDMIAQNYVESEKYIIRRVFQMPSDEEVEV